MPVLSLFDFDGTITKKDSMFCFIRFAVGRPAFYWGLLVLSPFLVAYRLKLILGDAAKRRLIKYFFKGWGVTKFMLLADQFSREQIGKITRTTAMDRIRWHQQQGHQVVIVSASMECWLRVWCEKNKLDLIATRLKVIDGKLTGDFDGRNCNGIEKVNRVKQAYDLSSCKYIYAYGDSAGDKELLELANESRYGFFKD